MKDNAKRLNLWPYGIVLVLLTFMTTIGYTIYSVNQMKLDMVTEDYYQRETEVNDKLAGIKAAEVDNAEVTVSYLKEAGQLTLTFPKTSDHAIDGRLTFYRPSDEELDFDMPLKLNADNKALLNVKDLRRGKWVIKIDYKAGERAYYQEKTLFL